jgi:hypothetical protein
MKTHSLTSNRAAFAATALCALLLAAQAASAQSPPAAPAPATPTAAPTAAQYAGVTAAASDIRDIRGPKPITSPWLMPLIAVTVLSAAGGAYAAWAWNRRRFREASKRPLDIALERLERARPLMLMVPPRAREFSIEVSSAVRDYIEGRFALRAAHLTTDEFLHQLLEPVDSLLAGHRSLLDHFLQTCDLAKFGGWNLAPVDMEAMLQSARQFIVESADDSTPHGIQPGANVQGAANIQGAANVQGAAKVRAAANVQAVQPSASPPPAAASRETYVSLPST